MRFFVLALTNLRRHRLRAVIGIAGIAFGVAAMLAIVSIVTGAIGMFERILSSDSHYLVFERNVSDLFFSSVTADQVEAIRQLPGVHAAHPLLFGLVSSPGHPVITCFGLERDDPRLRHATWLAGSAAEFGRTPGQVYLGARAAEFLKAQAGESVTIGRAEFRVGGILQSENGFEDGGIFLPLEEAQAFFHRGTASSIVAITLHDRGNGADFRARLEAVHPGLIALENREFSRSYNSFKILHVTAWAVGICAFALGGLGVANTMLLSVFSRFREIAVLRVCGFSRPQVALMIFAEAAALAAVGVFVGFILGWSLLLVLERTPQFQGYVAAIVPWSVAAGIVATAVVTAVAGAIYPARFAARIQPAEALRYE